MKLTIELERATDMTEETWVSHCLEIDAISQGETPRMAIESIAEAVDMMVADEIAAYVAPAPGWERAFANIADEVARRDAGSDPMPTIEGVAALVKEFVERLDRLGLSGSVIVRKDLHNGTARFRYEVSGRSSEWIQAEEINAKSTATTS